MDTTVDARVYLCTWTNELTNEQTDGNLHEYIAHVNPCPAEPGYTLPLQTV